ncbi:hypothetical protein P170DRAFT_474488 [Aspergillus steynii IBT 23096]|uniref:C2H2-type domain-containing protein n=1 Tax=Aspergillus steynii IBT 23096 TaxID=1392250 RepID=A0A2I2GDK0_9EURO|nr:uncharacterized protein P170DRAFT_474488 [Aspergillus steynii IBT 23096]PLB50940.1 hypothetical protein P170DRAFT_474488 [Aspergillus steynii IBT 23096]
MTISSIPTAPITDLYQKCIDAFDTLTHAISDEDCSMIRLGHITRPEVQCLSARLSAWGTSQKANYPARTRGSLEGHIRHDDLLLRVVKGCLSGVRMALTELGVSARRCEAEAGAEAGEDDECFSMVSGSSDADADAEQEQGKRRSRIRTAMDDIKMGIDLLDNVATMIQDGEVDEGAFADLGVEMEQIVGIVRSWRRKVYADAGADVPAPAGLIPGDDSVDDIMWFCERLARAQAKRKDDHAFYDPVDDAYDALAPYLCTFADCRIGQKLYSRVDDWIGHEQQVHRFEYVCDRCVCRTPEKQEFVDHLREHHPSPGGDLWELAETFRRQGEYDGEKRETCLLCRKEFALSDLCMHLQAHMETFSVLALPGFDWDRVVSEATRDD